MAYLIITIDDDPEISELYYEILTEHGYDVVQFGTGDGLLDFVEEVKPSLLIVDYKLPTINGIQLIKKLKRKTPCLLVTGYSHVIDNAPCEVLTNLLNLNFY